MDYLKEFDYQIQRLLQLQYPKYASLSESQFISLINPLLEKLKSISKSEINLNEGFIPFVIVVTNKLIDEEEKMKRVVFNEKPGVTKLFPHTSNNFKPLSSVTIPNIDIYLLLGIERGKEYLNKTPHAALLDIEKRNRTPLTIDEGIALITFYPDFLLKNNCFSLLASRNSDDKRVPAIWINGDKQANLGWCWDGNPHTWLGSASAKERIA